MRDPSKLACFTRLPPRSKQTKGNPRRPWIVGCCQLAIFEPSLPLNTIFVGSIRFIYCCHDSNHCLAHPLAHCACFTHLRLISVGRSQPTISDSGRNTTQTTGAAATVPICSRLAPSAVSQFRTYLVSGRPKHKLNPNQQTACISPRDSSSLCAPAKPPFQAWAALLRTQGSLLPGVVAQFHQARSSRSNTASRCPATLSTLSLNSSCICVSD